MGEEVQLYIAFLPHEGMDLGILLIIGVGDGVRERDRKDFSS